MNIIIRSIILIYFIGVGLNIFIYAIIPNEYFKEVGTSKKAGYIFSFFLPYIFFLFNIYYFLTSLNGE